MTSATCLYRFPTSKTEGLYCTEAHECQPRAIKAFNDRQLVLGSQDHPVVLGGYAGVCAVCYCEAWDASSCQTTDEWVLVGRTLVAGPIGIQTWLLDIGFVQSFTLEGFGFSDDNTIRILAQGESCTSLIPPNGDGLFTPTPEIMYCHPSYKGTCKPLGKSANSTHVADVGGVLFRHSDPRPMAYIESIRPDPPELATSTIFRFPTVSQLAAGDRIHFEPGTLEATASHWARKRDLQRIVDGTDVGHLVQEVMDQGFEVRVPLNLNPFPQIIFTNPGKASWHRSNKLRVRYMKGVAFAQDLPVCWGSKAGQYWLSAGRLGVVASFGMKIQNLGMTTQAVGAVAPMMISFTTGKSPLYKEAQNSMQLRIVFTNTGILEPMTSGPYGGDIPDATLFNQLYENSQATCGMLVQELWSDHEFGFPLPQGCYFDDDHYSLGGLYKAFYMLFEPMNGLAKDTRYVIVMNMRMRVAMTLEAYASLAEPLLEVVSLDDILVKPEGIVEVARLNPDKAAIEAARPGTTDPQWFNSGQGAMEVTRALHGRDGDRLPTLLGSLLEVPLKWGDGEAQTDADYFGFQFLLRGDTKGNITRRSIVRIYFWPLTVWTFDHRANCRAECLPEFNHTCSKVIGCAYEAAIAECKDIVPKGTGPWTDTKGRACTYYEEPGRCYLDGLRYTAEHGISAIEGCCACNGGVRFNANIARLSLPTDMDPATDFQIVHTISVYRLGPIPETMFFAERFGAQVTNPDDLFPSYTTSSGVYITLRDRPVIGSTVLTLVDYPPWGNEKQFKRDPGLNDIYVRLTMPITTYRAKASMTALTQIQLQLPEGYRCKAVTPVGPKDFDGVPVPLPMLPEETPTGNGALPDSTYDNSRGIGFNEGDWSFRDNSCTFVFAPHMAVFAGQRLWFYVYALNPMEPMPYTHPLNFWSVSFTSSGYAGSPAHAPPPCQYFLYDQVACNYFWNEQYPMATDLAWTLGPIRGAVPIAEATDAEGKNYYSDRLAVFGILEDVVVQPLHFLPAVSNTLQVWLSPDLGSFRGGFVGIECPQGFLFRKTCNARDLDAAHYAVFSPPGSSWAASVGSPRLWPLDGILACEVGAEPNEALIQLYGSMIKGRRYGFQIDVTNSEAWISPDTLLPWDNVTWAFKLALYDGELYGRDGTYTTASFRKWRPGNDHNRLESCDNMSWVMSKKGLALPVHVNLSSRRPFVETGAVALARVGPIRFYETTEARLRIIAPEGYKWSWMNPSEFSPYYAPVSEAPFPGGAPQLPQSGPDANVLQWHEDMVTFKANVSYAFTAKIAVPPVHPRLAAHAFFFEFADNMSFAEQAEPQHFERTAAVRAEALSVAALRNAKVWTASAVLGAITTVWVQVETTVDIPGDGSLGIRMPYQYRVIDNFTEDNDVIFWGAREADYVRFRAVPEFGSDPVPEDLRCREVVFPATGVPGTDGTPEVQFVISSNSSGLPIGKYVFEFRMANPLSSMFSPMVSSNPCGYRLCWSIFSNMARPEARWSIIDEIRYWRTDISFQSGAWEQQNEYWTSVPAAQIVRKMSVAEIVPLSLYELIWLKANGRPKQRNTRIIAMRLGLTPKSSDVLHIQAPVGFIFDGQCSVFLKPQEVYLPPLVFPTQYGSYPVEPWPTSAMPDPDLMCRGDAHEAFVTFGPGLAANKLYLFRIEYRANPSATPERNKWQLTLGDETSGEITGFPVWTFPNAFVDPVALAWTDKEAPQMTTLTFQVEVTNDLLGTGIELVEGKKLEPMIRIIMPPLFEIAVQGPDQSIQGGVCITTILEIGDCLRCEVPFMSNTYDCKREINRLNAAHITLTGDGSLVRSHTYRISLQIFNPKITDGELASPRAFLLESFFGEVAPPAEYPEGYAFDYAEVQGFKISERAALTVQIPAIAQSFGNRFVYDMHYTMTFAKLINPGDEIVMRAPPGFRMGLEKLVGSSLVYECMDFNWLPVVWPNKTEKDNFTWWKLTETPQRGGLPPRSPPWASSAEAVVALPVYMLAHIDTDYCASIHNVTPPFLFPVVCVRGDQWNETLLSKGVLALDAKALLQEQVPAWALAGALVEHERTANATEARDFLVIRRHCFGEPGDAWLSSRANFSKYFWRAYGPNTECLDCKGRRYKRYIWKDMLLDPCKRACEVVQECRGIHYFPLTLICHILVDAGVSPPGLGNRMDLIGSKAQEAVAGSLLSAVDGSADVSECYAFDDDPIVVEDPKRRCTQYPRSPYLESLSSAEVYRNAEAGYIFEAPEVPRVLTRFLAGGGECGQMNTNGCTQEEAHEDCHSAGQELATFGSESEVSEAVSEILSAFRLSANETATLWTGLRFAPDSRGWHWTDGRAALVADGPDGIGSESSLFGQSLGETPEDERCVLLRVYCPRPTPAPTSMPTSMLTAVPPTFAPTNMPTAAPSASPTPSPTPAPSEAPTVPTPAPTIIQTLEPTSMPTAAPTSAPTPEKSCPGGPWKWEWDLRPCAVPAAEAPRLCQEAACGNATSGAKDSQSQNCSWYGSHAGDCFVFDDDDFSASIMCCECGGGTLRPLRQAQPTYQMSCGIANGILLNEGGSCCDGTGRTDCCCEEGGESCAEQTWRQALQEDCMDGEQRLKSTRRRYGICEPVVSIVSLNVSLDGTYQKSCDNLDEPEGGFCCLGTGVGDCCGHGGRVDKLEGEGDGCPPAAYDNNDSNVTNVNSGSDLSGSTSGSVSGSETIDMAWTNYTNPSESNETIESNNTNFTLPPGCGEQVWPADGGCDLGEWRKTASRRRYGSCVRCASNAIGCGLFSPGSFWTSETTWSIKCESCAFQGLVENIGRRSLADCQRQCEAIASCGGLDHGKFTMEEECMLILDDNKTNYHHALDFDSYTFQAQWTTAVELSPSGGLVAKAISESTFQSFFDTCPVVRYVIGRSIHSVYVRISRFADVDPYKLFTYMWSDVDGTHVLGKDFLIYDTLEDLRRGEGAWSYCNYNEPGIGYPRQCGRVGMEINRSFAMPSFREGSLWLEEGARLEVYTGSSCPEAAQAPADFIFDWLNVPWNTQISGTLNKTYSVQTMNVTALHGGFIPCTDYIMEGRGISYCENCSYCLPHYPNGTMNITQVTGNSSSRAWFCMKSVWQDADGCAMRCGCEGRFNDGNADFMMCPWTWTEGEGTDVETMSLSWVLWANVSKRPRAEAAASNTTCLESCLARIQTFSESMCTELHDGALPRGVNDSDPTPVAFNLVEVPPCPFPNVTVVEYTNAANGTCPSGSQPHVSDDGEFDGMCAMNVTFTDTTVQCGCFCSCGEFIGEVMWHISGNLSEEIKTYEEAYEAAVMLAIWDSYPITAEPVCYGEYVRWTIATDNSHPDPRMRNGTTLAFSIGYQNPRSPPLPHENFWSIRHVEGDTGQVSSSDVVRGWRIIANLRYLRFELYNEVLRPRDLATIHVEFVTENPADTLELYGMLPEGWDFSSTYVSSPATDQLFPKGDCTGRLLASMTESDSSNVSQARRLGWPYTWKGYTSCINVDVAVGKYLRLNAPLQRFEYVRILLSGVILPSGGQGKISLFTSIIGTPMDELQDCCEPDYADIGSAVVFYVPYRLYAFDGKFQNKFQQQPAFYPIMYTFLARYNEYLQVTLSFSLPTHINAPFRELITFVIRAPQGYRLLNSSFFFSDSTCGKDATLDDCYFRPVPTEDDFIDSRRALVGLPGVYLLPANTKLRLRFNALSPYNKSLTAIDASPDSLWIVEATDSQRYRGGLASQFYGSITKDLLENQINFTLAVERSPPEVMIEIIVTIWNVGDISPTRIDVFAPLGYEFLPKCMKPGQINLVDFFVSCRERLSLFGASYLTGAILMSVDDGIPRDRLPVNIALLARTPADTPEKNTWMSKGYNRLGPVTWGTEEDGFPVSQMVVSVQFASTAGSVVPMFVAMTVRYGLSWGAYIHIAAPRTYQIHCPVTKVLAGPEFIPECLEEDPLLTGCFGLPAVGEGDPESGLPECDPRHEILLYFKLSTSSTVQPTTTQTPNATLTTLAALKYYALDPGITILLVLTVKVPQETPRPMTDNFFRLRSLDPNKIPEDGKLNIIGPEVRLSPQVENFRIWWNRALPDMLSTVAIDFSFNGTVNRNKEVAPEILRVIELVAPAGLIFSLGRPDDCQMLAASGAKVPVTGWNWTVAMPDRLWFGLDPRKNVSGRFFYSFPVTLPSAETGMPYENLWQVKFCADSPYCNVEILNVPIPGFFFGEKPSFSVDLDAGLSAARLAEPSLLLVAFLATAVRCLATT